MLITIVALFVVVAGKVGLNEATSLDPSRCQRIIKYHLIQACGAAKREFFENLPKYKVMSNEDIERRYSDMVDAGMIKGVDTNEIDGVDKHQKNFDKSDIISDYVISKLYNSRFKRSLMGVGFKTISEPITYEKRGSLKFIDRLPGVDAPTPGALKAKCCLDQILCSKDDFRGFCG